jgi:hypothetical protein
MTLVNISSRSITGGKRYEGCFVKRLRSNSKCANHDAPQSMTSFSSVASQYQFNDNKKLTGKIIHCS